MASAAIQPAERCSYLPEVVSPPCFVPRASIAAERSSGSDGSPQLSEPSLCDFHRRNSAKTFALLRHKGARRPHVEYLKHESPTLISQTLLSAFCGHDMHTLPEPCRSRVDAGSMEEHRTGRGPYERRQSRFLPGHGDRSRTPLDALSLCLRLRCVQGRAL